MNKEDLEKQYLKICNTIETCKQDLVSYRIQSTKRVLEYLLNVEKLGNAEIKDLLLFCLRKLDGGMDGIEIELGEE